MIDLLTGRAHEHSCAQEILNLSFAATAGEPILISGHRGGQLRTWDAVTVSPRTMVDTGGRDVEELCVVESGLEAYVASRNVDGQIRCWQLPTCDEIELPGVGVASALCSGRLADGRSVLLVGDDGHLLLWDPAAAALSDLKLPNPGMRIRGAVLSTPGGRDHVTVIDDSHKIITFQLATGLMAAPPLTAHSARRPDGLMETHGATGPHPKLAAVSGTLAVPTPWRVHLWDLASSQQAAPPLTGPVAYSQVQGTVWQGRNLLLTGSAYDGTVALWDLGGHHVHDPGHSQRVSSISVSDGMVVSADLGGTVLARDAENGELLAAPLATGVESTHALAAWREKSDVMAATGARSDYVPDGQLRRWNLTTGQPAGPPIKAHSRALHHLARVALSEGPALVSYGPGPVIKIWHPREGNLIAEVETSISSKVTGFAAAIMGERPYVAISSYRQPLTRYYLDDPGSPPTTVPGAAQGVILDAVGQYVVTAHSNEGSRGRTIVRFWDALGNRVGPDLCGIAEVTAVAASGWPAIYVGRADGSVALIDAEKGADLAPRLTLPIRPRALAVADDGDLVVAFGSDVARVRTLSSLSIEGEGSQASNSTT
ncbi:WD40 repeat domain-containing protein [Polymorphospora rubra]|uniref:WD40 repeat domain-containing protein n=1 Tax=Polymorphospora rubra TaxID=338584 RepID=UPI0033CE9EDA